MNKIPRGIRNNNPLNIIRFKNSKWAGMAAEQTDPSFCQFATMVYGWRAAFVLLRKYYFTYKLRTIRAIISRWAPPEDNNPTGIYIDSVVLSLNHSGYKFDADMELPDPDVYPAFWAAVVTAMAMVENGKALDTYSSLDEVIVGWHLCQLART